MSFFKKLASFFRPSGGLSQKTIDNYRASVLLSSFAQSKASGHTKHTTPEQMDQLFREVQEWSFEEFSSFAQDELHKQILSMFWALEKKATEGAAGTVAQSVGFSLELRPSSIPNAGNGVFVVIPPESPLKIVPAGSVVALFGGHVHLAEFTTKKDYVQQTLLPDPDMLCLVRVDEPIVIDGRTAHKCPRNPFALGHMVNHCGTTKPNVLQHPYNFPHDPLEINADESFPKELRRYIPNEYHLRPTLLGSPDRSSLMHGAVLIAARPIEHGTELLMDYRLSPSVNLPAWYSHFDEEQAGKRWS